MNVNAELSTRVMEEETEKPPVTKVFAYYRVSTVLQDIKMQRAVVKRFLKNNENIQVLEEFKDEFISGKYGFERKAFSEMHERLDEVDGILLYDWDRIARVEQFAVDMIYQFRSRNLIVFEASSGMRLDFNDMAARITTIMKSMWAEHERLLINKRTKDGIAAYKDKHKRWGRKPYFGSRKPKEREKIGINRFRWKTDDWYSEAQFWRFYEKYRLAGVSKSAIARLLYMSSSNLYTILNENKEKVKEIEDKCLKLV